MTDVNFNFRVDHELKERFVEAAREDNRNASMLLRDFIKRYLEERNAPDLQPQAPARQVAPATR